MADGPLAGAVGAFLTERGYARAVWRVCYYPMYDRYGVWPADLERASAHSGARWPSGLLVEDHAGPLLRLTAGRDQDCRALARAFCRAGWAAEARMMGTLPWVSVGAAGTNHDWLEPPWGTRARGLRYVRETSHDADPG